mmetsp:Transcript_19553/g.35819  ORF Transcript_19553/g.35819 Transcript_19553/m.35819 type:complete len:298 (+) Transcript_19553:738-1631(+)
MEIKGISRAKSRSYLSTLKESSSQKLINSKSQSQVKNLTPRKVSGDTSTFEVVPILKLGSLEATVVHSFKPKSIKLARGLKPKLLKRRQVSVGEINQGLVIKSHRMESRTIESKETTVIRHERSYTTEELLSLQDKDGQMNVTFSSFDKKEKSSTNPTSNRQAPIRVNSSSVTSIIHLKIVQSEPREARKIVKSESLVFALPKEPSESPTVPTPKFKFNHHPSPFSRRYVTPMKYRAMFNEVQLPPIYRTLQPENPYKNSPDHSILRIPNTQPRSKSEVKLRPAKGFPRDVFSDHRA